VCIRPQSLPARLTTPAGISPARLNRRILASKDRYFSETIVIATVQLDALPIDLSVPLGRESVDIA
jgi:hypothetical protein